MVVLNLGCQKEPKKIGKNKILGPITKDSNSLTGCGLLILANVLAGVLRELTFYSEKKDITNVSCFHQGYTFKN